MSNDTAQESQVANPIRGAGVFGLVGAAVVALGAAIQGDSVHNEAMTVLVGGVITGGIAGAFGYCIPDTKDADLELKIALGVLDAGLAAAAFLTAPLMGETIMNLGTEWGTTVVDELIGGGVIVGGALGVVAGAATVAGAGYCALAVGYCVATCNLTLFSPKTKTKQPALQTPIQSAEVTEFAVVSSI